MRGQVCIEKVKDPVTKWSSVAKEMRTKIYSAHLDVISGLESGRLKSDQQNGEDEDDAIIFEAQDSAPTLPGDRLAAMNTHLTRNNVNRHYKAHRLYQAINQMVMDMGESIPGNGQGDKVLQEVSLATLLENIWGVINESMGSDMLEFVCRATAYTKAHSNDEDYIDPLKNFFANEEAAYKAMSIGLREFYACALD